MEQMRVRTPAPADIRRKIENIAGNRRRHNLFLAYCQGLVFLIFGNRTLIDLIDGNIFEVRKENT